MTKSGDGRPRSTTLAKKIAAAKRAKGANYALILVTPKRDY